jgi:hypothetical protein
VKEGQKNPMKIDGQNHHMEDKTKGQRKVKTLARTKEGKELVLLVVGSYFTHSPSYVACMQIMRPNSIRKSRTNISRQCNLPFYSKGLSMLKNNTNTLDTNTHKKIECKKTRINDLSIVYCEKDEHTP